MKCNVLQNMSKRLYKLTETTKPARMWIDGKCFNIRKRKWVKANGKTLSSNEDTLTAASDVLECANTCEHEHFNVTPDKDGLLFTSFRLPAVYYCKINTHSIFKLQYLETDTKTNITIPKYGNEGHMTITGKELVKVVKARDVVHSLADEIRNSYRAIQFISIPTLSDEIKENFQKFKNDVLSDGSIEGMEESIFQSPHKLHLTIVVFALMDEFEKKEAIQALNDYKTSVLDPLIAERGQLKIVISGLDCMNDNHKKVDVLYANAKINDENEEFNLQTIANGLSEYFYERGLVRKYQDTVKLHVTLINTKYRKPQVKEKRKKWVKQKPFDARPVMEKYKDYYFGSCDFKAIHLSLISSVGDDGFYNPISIVKVS